MADTFAARLIVERMNVKTFHRLPDGVMLIAALSHLSAAMQ